MAKNVILFFIFADLKLDYENLLATFRYVF